MAVIQNCLPVNINGQRTEQVKTGQVNPDRPLVGPSVDTFVGCFVGSPRRAENRKIGPRGRSRGGSRGGTRGATRGPTRGATRGSTRGSSFAFACSVCRPIKRTVVTALPMLSSKSA